MPERGSVLVLTHIRDCSAIFDRYRVPWSIRAEVRLSARLCMDYKDTNCVKPDRIWVKTAKRLPWVQQERATKEFRTGSSRLALPSKAAS